MIPVVSGRRALPDGTAGTEHGGRSLRQPPHAFQRLPRVGAVLDLQPGQWRFGGTRPLRIRVTAVRGEIFRWYSGDWVWVDGDELNEDDEYVWPVQVLVSCDAIPDEALADGGG